MDLSTIVTSDGGRDYTWLASDFGVSNAHTATLDLSLFTSGTHYDATTKIMPGGIAIAQKTGGLFGPYDRTATDGRQTELYGFILDGHHLLRKDGTLPTNVGVAVLRVGDIYAARLPIAAQRPGGASDVTAATTTGQFVFEPES